MKRVFQQVTGYAGGDCFPACVASILELDLADVPRFCDEPEGWFDRFTVWLREWHGLFPVSARLSDGVPPIGGLCILSVPSVHPDAPPDGLHAVVGLAEVREDRVFFDVVHDPRPGASRTDYEPLFDVIWLVRVVQGSTDRRTDWITPAHKADAARVAAQVGEGVAGG